MFRTEDLMTARYDVPYMLRTRDYYRAQGYSADYLWAQNDETPFTPLAKPVNECRVAVVTTAMPDTDLGRGKRQVYASDCSPIPDSLYTDELSWHKAVTHTDDLPSFLPLAQLQSMAESGVIAALAPHFYSVPTDYSQGNTITSDAPEILRHCQRDEVDVVILVPL